MAEPDIVEELRAEIARLSCELDQASSEKIQSAQYGLGLLEEKGQLQQKCDELETLYENAKHELDITKEVSLMDHNTFTKQIGIEKNCLRLW